MTPQRLGQLAGMLLVVILLLLLLTVFVKLLIWIWGV